MKVVFMNMKNKLKGLSSFLTRFLLPATGLYTLFTLLLALPVSTKGLTRSKIFLLFFISVAIAGANLIFYIKKMGMYFKIATHFISLAGITLAALYFSGYMKTGRWVIILVAFVLLYAVVCPLILLARHYKIRKKNTDQSYVSLYDRTAKK